jgi:hypothetical protein
VCLIVCVTTETPKGSVCPSWEPVGKMMNDDDVFLICQVTQNIDVRVDVCPSLCFTHGQILVCIYVYVFSVRAQIDINLEAPNSKGQ